MSTYDESLSLGVSAGETGSVINQPRAATVMPVSVEYSLLLGKVYTALSSLLGRGELALTPANTVETAAPLSVSVRQLSALRAVATGSTALLQSAAVANSLTPRVKIVVGLLVDALIPVTGTYEISTDYALQAAAWLAPALLPSVKAALPMAVAARLLEASARSYDIAAALNVVVAEMLATSRDSEEALPLAIQITQSQNSGTAHYTTTELAASSEAVQNATVSVRLDLALRMQALLQSAVNAAPQIATVQTIQVDQGHTLGRPNGLSISLPGRTELASAFDAEALSEALSLFTAAGLLNTAAVGKALRTLISARVEIGVYKTQTKASLVGLVAEIAQQELSLVTTAFGVELIVDSVLEDVLDNHRPDTVWFAIASEWSQPTIVNEQFQ